MAAHRKNFSFNEAVQYLMEAKVITDGQHSVGTNEKLTEIVLPAGTIDARKNGFFHRDDLNKLIGWAMLG